MQLKFFALAALLIIGSVAAQGGQGQRQKNAPLFSKTKLTDSTFAMAPQAVIDTTAAGDNLFSKANAGSILFSPAEEADTVFAWLFSGDENTTLSIVKRTLDATSLKPKGLDIQIKSDIKSKMAPVGKAAVGYIGFPTIKDSGKDTADQFYFNILAANATESDSPIEALLTNNKQTDTGYMPVEALYLDGYFYVLFTEVDMKNQVDLALYLQGVKVTDGSLKFNTPVKFVSLSNQAGSSAAVAGFSADKSSIIVSWKDEEKGALMQSSVTLSTGNLLKSQKLRSDSQSAYYYPGGVFTSSGAAGVIVIKELYKDEDSAPTYNFAAFIDGQAKELEFDIPENYYGPMFQAFELDNGFALVGVFSSETDAMYQVRTFDSKLSTIAEQKEIGTTTANMQFFSDAENALWLGYSDFKFETGAVSKSYLGKLLA